jgi:hypothetical protein
MNRGSGVKDRDDKSSGVEILMADAFAKINGLESDWVWSIEVNLSIHVVYY